jgi:threonine aldolase
VTTVRKSFGSDNHAGVHPAVLTAIAEANSGDAVAYGEDPWTAAAKDQIASAFGSASEVLFVFNGTAANVLGVSLMLRRFDAVICAESAHLHVDECGAIERVTGAKLLTIEAPDGKLTPDLIEPRLTGLGDEHRAQPRVVAIAQVTEVGTCYTLAELSRLATFCRENDLYLYIDGARLSNAAAHLGCSLADIAAHANVLSFGGTKNGALGAEAVLVMDPRFAAHARFERKQQMQLASKMRFLAVQFAALLADDLWLSNASHANSMALRLAGHLETVPGVRLWQPVESNGVFAVLDPRLIAILQREWTFHVWDDREHVVRWMTAFDTSTGDVDAFAAAIRAAAEQLTPVPAGQVAQGG